MISILFYLSCSIPIRINESGLDWNSNDEKCFNSAQKRCSYYFPEAPCLKKFIKKDYNRYWAICGEQK